MKAYQVRGHSSETIFSALQFLFSLQMVLYVTPFLPEIFV